MLKKSLLLVVIFSSVCFLAFSQRAKVRMADKEYKQMRYLNAVKLYEQALENDSSNTHVKVMLAHSYYQLADMRNAERLYLSLAKAGTQDSSVFLHLAQALSQNGKYAESKIWYEKYRQKVASDSRPGVHSSAYNDISGFFADSARYKLYYLSMNSGASDFSPAPYKSGFIFSSARAEGAGVKRVYGRNNTPFLNLYLCDTSKVDKRPFITKTGMESDTTRSYFDEIDENFVHDDETVITSNDTKTLSYHGIYVKPELKWGREKLVPSTSLFDGKINTKYHEGPATFTKNGDTAYFTRNNYNGFRPFKSKDKINKLAIYMSVYQNGKWKKAKILHFCSRNFSTGHPALSADGKTLYYTSDRSGGYGKTDLYKSYLIEGKWSGPVNLGATINTEGDELFPYADKLDNIYFASNGHAGLGGLDIFVAKPKLKPKNLGYPVNSRNDDFGFIINGTGTAGYISSNRKRGGPDDDIYAFTFVPNPPVWVKAVTIDALDKSILDSVTVSIEDTCTKKSASYLTKKDGLVLFKAGKDCKYLLKPSKPEYLAQSIVITPEMLKDIKDTFKLEIPLMPEVKCVTVTGRVLDKETRKPLKGAKLHIKMNNDGYVKIKTDSLGNYSMCMDLGNKFIVKATKPRYLSDCFSTELPAKASRGLYKVTSILALKPLKRNMTFKIENVYYDYNKSDIRPDAAQELDKLVVFLQENKGIKVELGSHTDSRGSDTYNLQLSQKRAVSAVNYIVTKGGIDRKFIVAKGYGESKPINRCKNGVKCKDAEFQANRRTEVKIIGFVNVEEDYEDESVLFNLEKDNRECEHADIILIEKR